MRSITSSIDAGTHVEPSKMTLAEWLDIWSSEYLVGVKRSTKTEYQAVCDTYITPRLGRVKLSALQPHTIQKFVNGLRSVKTGEQLSRKSVKNIVGVLSSALEQSRQIGYIASKPAKGAKLPCTDDEEKTRNIKPLDSAETERFLEVIRGTRYERIYRVALYLGLRLSECLGLRWESVNLRTAEITVDKQLTLSRRAGEPRRLTATKSRNRRTFICPRSVLSLFTDQKREQTAWRLAAGPAWNNPDGLVFTDEIGGSLSHSSVEHQFTSLIAKAGLSQHTFHDLRHTACMQLLRAGVDPGTVSRMLGHASVAFTLDIYSALTGDLRQDAADKLQALIDSRKQA